MKHAVIFITLTFLATLILVGWTNGGLGVQERHVLGARSSFWSRIIGKIWQPKAIPTRGFVKPTGVVSTSESGNVSDDPEIDLSNLEQELRSLDQEMNAVKLLN